MPEKVQLGTPPAEIMAIAELSEDAKRVLRDDSTSAGFVKDLTGAGLFVDAVKQLAHGLGGRKCVAWSLACAQELQPDAAEKEKNAFRAVEKWLTEPSDPNRRAAQNAGEQAKVSTAAGCVAMAAFFSEGSIAPPETHEIPVPPHVAEKIAAGGIMLAVVARQPERAEERYRRCIELGLKNPA